VSSKPSSSENDAKDNSAEKAVENRARVVAWNGFTDGSSSAGNGVRDLFAASD
jgi:hypothetical protein